jgi:membrane protease YdiL (CAAX protease family)
MFASLLRRLSQPEPAPPWGLFAAINAALVGLIAIVAGSFIGLTVFGAQPAALLTGWTIGSLATVLFVSLSRRQPDERAALRLEGGASRLYLVLLFSLGMAVVIDLIGLAASGTFLPAPQLIDLYNSPESAFAWLIAVALLLVAQPVAEELVFRGMFYPAARARLGPWPALVLTAAVYMLFHYVAYARPGLPLWYALFAPLLAGLVLTGVRAYTGSTRAAIVAHAAFGLFALLKLLALVG